MPLAPLLLAALAAGDVALNPVPFPADAELRDVHGARVTLGGAVGAEARAAVVVFVGTECPLVQLTAPRLRAVAEEGREHGVRVVLIDANRQDSLSDLAAFRKRHEFDTAEIPVLKDPRQRAGRSVESGTHPGGVDLRPRR